MAIRSGFFNSVSGDRRYLAGNFAEYFSTFIGNGVFPNPSSGLQVISNGGLNLSVKAGKGWINGYYLFNDSDYELTLDGSDSVLSRIDRVIMRLSLNSREIEIRVKKGTYSGSPIAQPLTRDSDFYELALADINVNSGILGFSQSNITDQRMNSALCGIVQGTVNQVDTTTIYNQYEDWFNQTRNQGEIAQQAQLSRQEQEFRTWFEGIMGILDGDVAGNLANEIARVEGKLDEHIADYIKHPVVATATFSNNQYTVNIETTPTILMEGMGVVFLARNDSTGDTTLKINTRTAYPILRPNGLPLTNVKANSYYAVRFSLVTRSFMLLGEGGEYGDATPSTVKRGVSFGTEDGLSVGTMPFLPERFIGETFYRTAIHNYAFSNTESKNFITADNKFFVGDFNGTIYKYDIEDKTYSIIGYPSVSGTLYRIFGNDNGDSIFAIIDSSVYYYNGAWTLLGNGVKSAGYSACSNSSGTDIFYANSNNKLTKMNVSTKVTTTLGSDNVNAASGALRWRSDNTIWQLTEDKVIKQINVTSGAVIKSITIELGTIIGISFVREQSNDIVASILGTNASGERVLVTSSYNGVFSQRASYQFSGTAYFVSSIDGSKFTFNDTSTRLIYKVDGGFELAASLPNNASTSINYQISSNGYYVNSGNQFTTVVAYK